jgi:hypothetical protein
LRCLDKEVAFSEQQVTTALFPLISRVRNGAQFLQQDGFSAKESHQRDSETTTSFIFIVEFRASDTPLCPREVSRKSAHPLCWLMEE